MADAQADIAAALEAYPSLHLRIGDVQKFIEAVPEHARHGAILFLVASLVAQYARHPRSAIVELNAHALDAVHEALTKGGVGQTRDPR